MDTFFIIRIACFVVLVQMGVACPDDWYRYCDSCYLFINDSLTFDGADSACRKQGACLTSAASEGENDFIARTVTKGQRSWVGGSDLCVDDDWQWDNGDPWVYMNWRRGEPSNRTGWKEHCVEINYQKLGLWNNHFCERLKSAVCRFPLS